jgi:hypothetical protein
MIAAIKDIRVRPISIGVSFPKHDQRLIKPLEIVSNFEYRLHAKVIEVSDMPLPYILDACDLSFVAKELLN